MKTFPKFIKCFQYGRNFWNNRKTSIYAEDSPFCREKYNKDTDRAKTGRKKGREIDFVAEKDGESLYVQVALTVAIFPCHCFASFGAAFEMVTRYTPEKIRSTAIALARLKVSKPRQIPTRVATIGCT